MDWNSQDTFGNPWDERSVVCRRIARAELFLVLPALPFMGEGVGDHPLSYCWCAIQTRDDDKEETVH